MTLLLPVAELAARRGAVAGSLAPLAESLGRDLREAIARVAPNGTVWVPAEKARMTRRGGRCERDGTLLAFDPFEPRRHRCPLCGREYDDAAHYEWWVMWYQLWLAERAVHASVLHLLTGDAGFARFASQVLDEYADRYLAYPNRDNVLGPTRPFFSTYLESIWLLQLCVALDALEHADGSHDSLGGRVRDRIIAPSRELIAGFDEKMSNRQVWNGAAMIAASRLLDEREAAERAVHGRSGLAAQLSDAVLADGTWYEGENYHQFAHRGLWYAVTLTEQGGDLPEALVRRFEAGFVAPFLTALPDYTLPARRDSQYAISLRQWRYAESCELGLARGDDPRLAGALARLYADDGVGRGDTGRWRSAAESERNEPATSLSRADLGWRSLLHARLTPTDAAPWAPGSALLAGQGIGVLRRDGGRLYAALDYGHSGGGHGHPDRLNVLLVDGDRRLLDDMGTGSYVDRSLHWYRSTLAHNAPLVDGRSQQRVDGTLLAFDSTERAGWVRAEADIAPGVRARRTLVATDAYVLDQLEWRADRSVTVDVPYHVDADVCGAALGPWTATTVEGAGGLEDGFDFLRDVRAALAAGAATVEITAPQGVLARVHSAQRTTWLRAAAPGPPGSPDRGFVFARITGDSGRVVAAWDVRGALSSLACEERTVAVTCRDATVDTNRDDDGAWTIDRRPGDGPRWSVRLGGTVPASPRTPSVPASGANGEAIVLTAGEAPTQFEMAEEHYRPSELSWTEAGRPRATVSLGVAGVWFVVVARVRKATPIFAPPHRENALDNELADINSDGIQLYVRPGGGPAAGALCGWVMVPEANAGVRVTPVAPGCAQVAVDARSQRSPAGYAVRCAIALDAVAPGDTPFDFDLIVNEISHDRERRRGQLVLSGARGEFVYLQGDRHQPRLTVAVRGHRG